MLPSLRMIVLVIWCGLPVAAMAHAPPDDASATAETFLQVGLGVAAVLYAIGALRLSHRGRDTSILLRSLAFVGGWVSLRLALLSPLDEWSATSFAAHMVQHEALMLVAAPLLVLSRPLPVFLWALPSSMRRAVSAGARSAGIATAWRWLNLGAVGWLLHASALWIWHAPPLFRAALRDPALHELQHATFLATALLFWSALMTARGAGRKGAAALYLFTTTIHTGALGALITFATAPWYTPTLRSGEALAPLADQQLGGLIMWVPGSIVYVVIGLLLLLRWVRDSDPPPTRVRSHHA